MRIYIYIVWHQLHKFQLLFGDTKHKNTMNSSNTLVTNWKYPKHQGFCRIKRKLQINGYKQWYTRNMYRRTQVKAT